VVGPGASEEPSTCRVLAFVPDLMDRSRLSAPGIEVRFAGLGALAGVGTDTCDLVVVDLARPGVLEALAAAPPTVAVVGFGPHVDDALLDAARAAGIGDVLPRSRFFARWPSVGGSADGPLRPSAAFPVRPAPKVAGGGP